MKRAVLIILLAATVFGCVACGGTPAPATTEPPAGTDLPQTTETPFTTEQPEPEKPMPEGDYVLLDGTGRTEGAYATLLDAANALPATGGSIVVVGNTATPTEKSVTLPEKPLTVCARKNAVLTVGRALLLSGDTVFTDITLENGAAANLDFIYAQGHNLTVTDTVETRANASTSRNLTIFAGGATGANINAASTLTLSGGVWRNVYLGNWTGSFAGTVNVLLDGATVTGGSFFFSNCNGGASTATCRVELRSGSISAFKRTANSSTFSGSISLALTGGTLQASELAPGSKTEITADLSAGGTLILGGTVKLGTVTGGDGELRLTSSASATVSTLAGTLNFGTQGFAASDHVYLTIQNQTEGTVVYRGTAGELLAASGTKGTTYQLANMKTTNVRVYYGNPDLNAAKQPQILLIRGISSTGERLKNVSTGKQDGVRYIEANLAPGIYCYKEYYDGSNDYGIKYFYLDGSKESVEYTMMLAPNVENNYSCRRFSNTTDEVLRAFYNTLDIKDFKTYETPTFTNHSDQRTFITNDELCAFCEQIAKENDNAYVFYPIGLTEQYGLRTPVLVFTNDKIKAGATMEELAATVRAGGTREIILLSGGMHGNEPAGEEGILAYATELCGDYGKAVLDRVGAVVMIPGVSADNLKTFVRNYPDEINANRDLIACEHDGSRAYVAVYNAFLPTVTVACHEDTGVLTVDESDYSVTDTHNMAFLFNGPANCPVNDVNGIVAGTTTFVEQQGMQMLESIIDEMNAIGYRAQNYRVPDYYPICERGYSASRGSYAFLIELNGIDNARGNYELRVHGHVAAVKAIVNRVLATNGGVAETVKAAREAVAVTTYDENNLFILQMAQETHGTDPLPSIYLDGTYKDKNAVKSWSLWTKVIKTRSMPTAYVIPADTPNVDGILALLDVHGIAYTRIAAGSTLELKKYSISVANGEKYATATLGAAKAVSFANGAYVISTDTPDAYLVAYLFEPDSYTSDSGLKVSFFKMGYMGVSDALYRSETDNIADVIAPMTQR